MLINKNLIVINLEAENKRDAISKLISMAKSEDKITSEDDFFQCVLKRESEFSTGIGNGIAIPHGKSETVKEAIVAFAKLKKGIDWEAMDCGPVDLIFLLGVPERNKENLHLKILAQLSRRLMDEDFVRTLRDSWTEQEVYEVLKDIETA